MDGKNNVILFPGSIERLMTEGLNALKAGDFDQGLKHFNQTLAHDETHEQARYGRLVCLLELGHLEESKTNAEEMLREGIGDYEDVLFFYVSALVQLGEWDAVIETIETERKTSRLPAKYAEHFFQFLATAKTMNKDPLLPLSHQEETSDELVFQEEETPTGLVDQSTEEQWRTFQQLKQRSWPQVKSAFQEALLDDNTTPVIKTLILLVMKDWEVGGTVPIRKHNEKTRIIPVQLDGFSDYESERKTAVYKHLEEKMADDNPVMHDTARAIFDWILMEWYPFPLPEATEHAWAAAIHMESAKYMGISEDLLAICTLYDANPDEVERPMQTLASRVSSQE